MMIKTHIAISVFFILLFFSKVQHQIPFVLITLFTAVLPDVDSKFSSLGKKKIFRILQFFVKHRGILHSFTFLIFVTLFFALFFPIISLPFFLGYSSHLIADSFTIEGIFPFYPLKKKSFGKIREGGKIETIVLILFVFVDVALFLIQSL